MIIKLFKEKTFTKILKCYGDAYILKIWIFYILISPKHIAHHSMIKDK